MTLKKFFLAGILLLLIATTVALHVDFDASNLGQSILNQMSKTTGLILDADRFRFNLLEGLILEGVRTSEGFPGARYRIKIERLTLSQRWLSLLKGDLVFESLIIERPVLEISTGVKRNVSATIKRSTQSSLPLFSNQRILGSHTEIKNNQRRRAPTLDVQEMRVIDGSIIHRKEGTNALMLSSRGLGLELQEPAFEPQALTPLHGLSAVGSIEIQELSIQDTTVRTVSGNLRMARGHLELMEVSLLSDTGNFVGNLALDFNTIPFRYQMSLLANSIDLNLNNDMNGSFGRAALELDGEGFGTNPMNLSASGTFRLHDGVFQSSQVLRSIETILGRLDLIGSSYQATEATFELRNGRLIIDSLKLVDNEFEFELQGNVDLNGTLQFRLVLRASSETLKIAEVNNEGLDSWTNDKGQISIPFSITGTTTEPLVELENSPITPASTGHSHRAK